MKMLQWTSVLVAGVFSLAAVASDVATVRVVGAGGEEAVEIDLEALKVGESRQLSSTSGSPAVVTRTQQGLSIAMGGKTTEVQLGGAEDFSWHDHHDGEASEHAGHLRFVHVDADKQVTAGDGEQKIVVIRHHGDADGETIDAADVERLVAEAEAGLGAEGDGEKVIVTRKIVREEAAAQE